MLNDWIPYLLELRKRLLRVLLVFAVIVIPASFFSKQVYSLFTLPLLHHFPHRPLLIATSVPAPFLVPFKSVLWLSFLIIIPYLLYQLWAFIAPALYRHERKLLWSLMLGSSILFYLGMLFAYGVILPIIFRFFISAAPTGVEVRPDISEYFDFLVRMFIAFGFAFEIPVLILISVYTGICSRQFLSSKRPYIIVVVFFISMLLTPPDVLSQIMLAVPLWFLFELGLWLSRFAVRTKVGIVED